MANEGPNMTPHRNMANALGHVEARLESLLATPRAEVEDGQTPIQNAKLSCALAYSVGSLFYMLLKTKGLPCQVRVRARVRVKVNSRASGRQTLHGRVGGT